MKEIDQKFKDWNNRTFNEQLEHLKKETKDKQ